MRFQRACKEAMIVASIDEVPETDIEEEESNAVITKRKGKLCCWLYVVLLAIINNNIFNNFRNCEVYAKFITSLWIVYVHPRICLIFWHFYIVEHVFLTVYKYLDIFFKYFLRFRFRRFSFSFWYHSKTQMYVSFDTCFI